MSQSSAIEPIPLPELRLEAAEADGYAIQEYCSLDHERQVLTVTGLPDPEMGEWRSLRDVVSGLSLPIQRSTREPGTHFVQLELKAHQQYRLVPDAAPGTLPSGEVMVVRVDAATVALSNGRWTVETFLGRWTPAADEWGFPPGPVRRVGIKGGPLRGTSFLDTREPVRGITAEILEQGPVRTVVRYHAVIGSAHYYTAHLTFDAGLDFVRIDEAFSAGAGDQIVWDFTGPDLPVEIHKLDATAGFSSQRLHYVFDHRHARLAAWNQYSQLHDYSDGYVLTFAGASDSVGCVALAGGDWQGNSLNFLEGWERRWLPGDPASRRMVPAEAKADAAPSPERIAARPANQCEPHFSFEGWIGRGRRSFALLLAARANLRPADWNATAPLGHFETTLTRERYRQQQSLPRRIHTQHGMLPLADQLATRFVWPEEPPPARAMMDLDGSPEKDADAADSLLNTLQVRVFGFWEGSGSTYVNAVVCRRLAHDLVAWEQLTARGRLSAERRTQGRAWFAFMCRLFASDHYYPGGATMNLGGPGSSVEPTIAGMANQNFYTDVFNLPAMAAQVFHRHPDAARWRDTFTTMWRRQLEYHVYPESGLWEESHTYCHHVLVTVLPTLERRRDDGVDNGFADPAFHRLVSSLLSMQTPRDASYGNRRYAAALGDHQADITVYADLYGRLAVNLAPCHPELASQLAWMHRERGGTLDVPVPAVEYPRKSQYVQGLGFFFRGQDANGESLLVLRCGSAWAHHHHDDGSIQFFAAGRSWIVDSAFSYPQRNGVRKFRADGHSRWMPRDLFPLNFLWQFNRGWITAHSETAAFPYAVAYTPVFMAQTADQPYLLLPRPILHWRTVVQLAPAAFLVLDRTEVGATPVTGCQVSPAGPEVTIAQAVRFHVPGDAPLLLEHALPAGAGDGCRLRVCSLFGAEPPEFRGLDRASGDEPYVTQEVCYEVHGKALAAFLIMVERADDASLVIDAADPRRTTLRHADFEACLEVDPGQHPAVVNLRAGTRLVLRPE